MCVFPPDSKVLSSEPSLDFSTGDSKNEGSRFVTRLGIPWSQDEFVKEAVAKGHPYASRNLLSEELAGAVDANLQMDPMVLSNMRRDISKDWLHQLALLKEEEAKLKQKLDPEVAETLCSKRLLLWKHMLEQAGFQDVALPEDVSRGFSITGEILPSGVFPKSFVPATATVDELRELAGPTAALAYMNTKSSGDQLTDQKLWDKTLEERAKGWIQGPLEGGLSALQPGQTLTRRFAVAQGLDDDGTPKVRPIDDFSASHVNSTVTANERVTLHTLDVISATLAYFISVSSEDVGLMGKSYDLKSAYKQLPLCKTMEDFAHIVVWDLTEKKPQIFRTTRLPFGAVASVLHFLRCSKSLWYIICSLGKVICTAYFDDFVVFSPELTRVSASNFVELVFLCIGWTFDMSGKKASEFASQVSALEAIIDLQEVPRGIIKLRNTEKRINDLSSIIANITAVGKLGHLEAQQLRGKLTFADNQVHGRMGPLLMKALSEHIHSTNFTADASDTLLTALPGDDEG